MAFYDNKLWLLSHIHNSFISSDDTGVCEMVMGGPGWREELEVVARSQGLTAYLPTVLAGEEEEEVGGRSSPEIRAGPGRRERTNTAAMKLQEKLRSRDEAAGGKTVVWRAVEEENGKGGEDDRVGEELFPRKDLKGAVVKKRSTLSERLEQRKEETNEWQQFAKWAGAHFPEAEVRRVQVFPVLVGEEAGAPMEVSCSGKATVREVVGLVAWRYTQEGRLPVLEGGPQSFELFMCEEDGSVDRDFPALDSRETFSKYGFQQLALVRTLKNRESDQHRIKLHLPDGSFTELGVDRGCLTMGDLLALGLERRKRTLPPGLKYHLEAADKPGVALEPAVSLDSHQGAEFHIVRSNSKRPSGPRDTTGGELTNIYEVHLFQSFDVQMITKVRTKVDIHLGVSGEKVEIDPKPQASWSVYKQKAATYDMEAIVSCEVVGRGGEDRLTVRMVHLADSGWRWVEFEGSRGTVEALVDKVRQIHFEEVLLGDIQVNHLLEMRLTPARKQRKEYLENKERKKSMGRVASKI